MNTKASKIWKVFCEELIGEPTEDQSQALASVLREIANTYQYYHFGPGEDMVVDARILYEISEELEK